MVDGPMDSTSNPPSNPYTPPELSSAYKIRDADWVSNRLKEHGIVKDNTNVLLKYRNIQTLVDKILQSSQGMAMNPQSAQRIVARHAFLENANKATILTTLLPLIIRPDYMKRKESGTKLGQDHYMEAGEYRGTEINKDDYVLEDWFEAGVATASNQEFSMLFLPSNVKELVKTLRKDDKMTNPRPDRCIGIRQDKFARDESTTLDIDIEEVVRICPFMDHAYFLIEGKSDRGVIGEAENQARCGGSILVNANRFLHAVAGESDVLGADSKTVAFSATMTADLMTIYIHWAEIQEGAEVRAVAEVGDGAGVTEATGAQPHTIIHHMTPIKTTCLYEPDQLPSLRKVLENILHWGVHDRFPELVKLRTKLYEVSRKRKLEQNVSAAASAIRTTPPGEIAKAGSVHSTRSDLSDIWTVIWGLGTWR